MTMQLLYDEGICGIRSISLEYSNHTFMFLDPMKAYTKLYSQEKSSLKSIKFNNIKHDV